MIKKIKNAVVLGSGIMGSGIACHLANIGLEVLLLDIVSDNDQSNSNKEIRNSRVNSSLKNAVKSKPSPIFTKFVLNNITTGNFTDDFEKIKNYDWIIEVVVEQLKIKNIILKKWIDTVKDSIVSTNTSGIPITSMIKGRSENFKSHFLGTHFSTQQGI